MNALRRERDGLQRPSACRESRKHRWIGVKLDARPWFGAPAGRALFDSGAIAEVPRDDDGWGLVSGPCLLEVESK
jgi:hypothetical protein